MDFNGLKFAYAKNATLTATQLAASTERLSTGLRINSAKDDTAGLALSSKLESQSKLFSQGTRNVSDAISLLNVASTAVDALNEVVTRLTELSNSGARTALSAVQRDAIVAEANALTSEYNRIRESTTFNGQTLFGSNSFSGSIQIGEGSSSQSYLNINLAETGLIAAGNGTFGAATSLAAGDGPYAIELADLNNDGNLDIISAATIGDSVDVRLGNGDGTFGASVSYDTNSAFARGLAVNDFNNDGFLDILGGSNGTVIALGRGDGTFGSFTTVSTVVVSNAEILALDANSDGNLDFVQYGSSGFLNLYLGSGSGSFTLSQSIAALGVAQRPGAVGDVDGDGDIDVVTGDGNGTYLYRNSGGTFAAAATAVSGYGDAPSLADVDQDGNLDILAATTGGAIRVSLNNGSGTFTTTQTISGIGGTLNHLEVADINGDGFFDVVGISNTVSAVAAFLGNGDGSFSSPITRTLGANGAQIALGDLDNNGSIDAVGTMLSSDALSVMLATATATSREFKIRRLNAIDLSSLSSSRKASDYLETVSQELQVVQGKTSSLLSRFGIASSLTSQNAEVYKAASEKIREANLANEVANQVSLSILANMQEGIFSQGLGLTAKRVATLLG